MSGPTYLSSLLPVVDGEAVQGHPDQRSVPVVWGRLSVEEAVLCGHHVVMVPSHWVRVTMATVKLLGVRPLETTEAGIYMCLLTQANMVMSELFE